MTNSLVVDNYIITEPLINIINALKVQFPSQKLRDVRVSSSEIVVTCVNSNHSNGLEKNPDAHINLLSDRAPYGWYFCFACNLSCSFVGFIQHYLDSTLDFAKEWLIKNFGIQKTGLILNLADPINLNGKKKKPTIDPNILNTYQHWTPYLAKRHISAQTAEKLNIRYDPVYRQVIFPIYDSHNNLVMLAKRSVDTKVFNMTKDVEKPVYQLNNIINNGLTTAVLVEGLFDCATCYEFGYNGIATLGAVSEHQIELINKSGIRILYICMDNDESGRRFTNYIKNRLNKNILMLEVSLPVNKKDINELSKAEFDLCIQNAK